MTAADRFRQAVETGDLDAMVEALAPDVRLYSPTMPQPLHGRARVRAIFNALHNIFEDFEYTRQLAGGPPGHPAEHTSAHALVFRCRVGDEQIEGMDLFDLDEHDRIATFTVMIRPLAGLNALAQAIAARLGQTRPADTSSKP